MASKNDRPLAEAFKSLLSPSQVIEYAVIDAFSDGPFGGNPAAVVLLKEWKDEEWLQNVAAEFNLSETAYVKKIEKQSKKGEGEDTKATEEAPESGPGSKPAIQEYELRWFTPATEVDLCGHATLASAHLLYHSGIVDKKDTIFFHTKSGLLSTRRAGLVSDPNSDSKEESNDPKDEVVEMNFPWTTTTPSSDSDIKPLPGMLGGVEVVAVGKASNYLIVELASTKDLDTLEPDVQELLSSSSDGLIATAPGAKSSEFDFVSRCFFPKYGVNEDPVTGMAHTILGPYWSTRLKKSKLCAHQASKRGGTLEVEVDKKIGRVYLRGRGVLVMSGILFQ